MHGSLLSSFLVVGLGCSAPQPVASDPPTVGVPPANGAPVEPSDPSPGQPAANDVVVMRTALTDDGAGLTDEEVLFLHDALQ